MAIDVCWNNLPSVVLLEVFQRISHKERISASSTCKEWRKALYYPVFWRDIRLNLFSDQDVNSIERCHFFARSFLSSSRNVTIITGYQDHYVREMKGIMKRLSQNRQIKQLMLFGVGAPVWNLDLRACSLSLIQIIDNCKKLDTLCLGHCWFTTSLKTSLEKHQATLTCLHIGAGLIPEPGFSPVDFSVFSHLRIVSLNHCYVTDDVVIQLCDNSRLLKRFIVQVEGYQAYYNFHVKDETWEYFNHTMSDCEFRLNIIEFNSESAITSLPSCMPVTHIKILYCDKLSLQSLSLLASFKGLKSVHCVVQNYDGSVTPSENPFVMCSWCCPKFEELVISGYKLDYEDLIGIARLAGSRLKTLQVYECDVIMLYDVDSTNEWESRNLFAGELKRFKTVSRCFHCHT